MSWSPPAFPPGPQGLAFPARRMADTVTDTVHPRGRKTQSSSSGGHRTGLSARTRLSELAIAASRKSGDMDAYVSRIVAFAVDWL